MELNDLIPLKFRPHDCDWLVKGNYLMYKKYEHVPVAFIDDDIVYIFLENKIQRQILKLTKWVIDSGYKFYFTTPELSNPKGVEYLNEKVITHYLFSYAQKPFYIGFKKMEFDLIKNMVDWCIKENCSDLIKDCYEVVLKKVNNSYFDYYAGKDISDYDNEIRDDFRTLYRDIQINMIL